MRTVPPAAEEAGTAGGSVRVVFYAGAAALAGCREAMFELEACAGDGQGNDAVGHRDGRARAPADRLRWLRGRLGQRFPRLARLLDTCQLAVNGRLVKEEEARLGPGDEVAVLPPASGGSGEETAGPVLPAGELPPPVAGAGGAAGRLLLTEEPLSVDEALRSVAHTDAGAIVLFLGTVRRRTGPLVTDNLYYEAHPGLARAELATIVGEAEGRWPGVRLAVAHRLGLLRPGEVSVVMAAAAPHRDDAFAACRYAIEELKRRVPIWKEERGPGGSFWVLREDPGCGEGAAGDGGTQGAGRGEEAGGVALTR